MDLSSIPTSKKHNIPFIAIYGNTEKYINKTINKFNGLAKHIHHSVPDFIPQIWIGVDSNYGLSVIDIEQKKAKSPKNIKFIYTNEEIEDYFDTYLEMLYQNMDWIYPKPIYSHEISKGFTFMDNKNDRMQIQYTFNKHKLLYKLNYKTVISKKEYEKIPYSMIDRIQNNKLNSAYIPFIYVVNGFLMENKDIIRKYRTFCKKTLE